MTNLRILIADDHPLFRKGIRGLLTTMPDVELVGEAETGPQAIEMAVMLQPDMILMDLQMPEGTGIDATRQIVQASPHIRVLVLTLFEDKESVFAALRAGARGYILKDAGEEEIRRAILAVSDGEAIFSPDVATRVIDYFATVRPTIPEEVFPDLTDREREILNLIAKGETNNEIAHRLTIALKTVQNHVSNIFNKLQVADRAQAVIRAREAGLGTGQKSGSENDELLEH